MARWANGMADGTGAGQCARIGGELSIENLTTLCDRESGCSDAVRILSRGVYTFAACKQCSSFDACTDVHLEMLRAKSKGGRFDSKSWWIYLNPFKSIDGAQWELILGCV